MYSAASILTSMYVSKTSYVCNITTNSRVCHSEGDKRYNLEEIQPSFTKVTQSLFLKGAKTFTKSSVVMNLIFKMIQSNKIISRRIFIKEGVMENSEKSVKALKSQNLMNKSGVSLYKKCYITNKRSQVTTFLFWHLSACACKHKCVHICVCSRVGVCVCVCVQKYACECYVGSGGFKFLMV